MMTVAATQERLDVTMAWLVRLAARGRPAPTNKQIGLVCLKMGAQRYQPADRTIGIKWPKAEHGAVIIRELERRGLIAVQRGSNWRRITILRSPHFPRAVLPVPPSYGLELPRRTPCYDGSSWRRQIRADEAA